MKRTSSHMRIVGRKFILWSHKKIVILSGALLIIILAAFYTIAAWGPMTSSASALRPVVVAIEPGDGFRAISERLAAEHIIHSGASFELLSLLTGNAGKFKPGSYELSSGMTNAQIIEVLVSGPREAEVTIPEGASVYEIDKILSDAKIVPPGKLVALSSSSSVEGTLFPDTYKFLTNSKISDAVSKFEENFFAKTASSSLDIHAVKGRDILILASIVEKEVPGEKDREIVAGILQKRLKAGMALNVDATICYAKQEANFPALHSCYPLIAADFKIDSVYNTYSHRGLPPGAIGNPGLRAIAAVLRSTSSPYWFYLSDPKTGRTIYAKTLDEQNENRFKYLGN